MTQNQTPGTAPQPLLGLHHVTAIAGDAQANLSFYTGPLGLRLVKKTVNFDDPGTYHFYFGNAAGDPGSILTFFPWATAAAGHPGSGQATTTRFAVPTGSLSFWEERLAAHDVDTVRATHHGEDRLDFTDPDGLPLALVEITTATDVDAWSGRSGDPVPESAAIRGIEGVELLVPEPAFAPLGALLELLGGTATTRDAQHSRFRFGEGPLGQSIDVLVSDVQGQAGRGTVHHIAFRVPDDEAELAWLAELRRHGLGVSDVRDRQYFHSIYFRVPGGILFEIATDPPGFTIDEAPDTLGQELRLPPQYEGQRAQIEAILPQLS